MLQLGRRLRLAPKPASKRGIHGKLGRKEFQGDLAVEPDVLGPIDLALGTPAEELDDAVGTDAIPAAEEQRFRM